MNKLRLKGGPDILPIEQNAALRWLEQTVQVLDERGFSGACVADDPDEFARVYRKIDVFHRAALKRRAGTVDMCKVFRF